MRLVSLYGVVPQISSLTRYSDHTPRYQHDERLLSFILQWLQPPRYFWEIYELYNIKDLKFDGVYFPGMLQQIPKLLALFFVVAFGSSLDVAAIQADSPEPLDYNHELKTVGEPACTKACRLHVWRLMRSCQYQLVLMCRHDLFIPLCIAVAPAVLRSVVCPQG